MFLLVLSVLPLSNLTSRPFSLQTPFRNPNQNEVDFLGYHRKIKSLSVCFGTALT